MGVLGCQSEIYNYLSILSPTKNKKYIILLIFTTITVIQINRFPLCVCVNVCVNEQCITGHRQIVSMIQIPSSFGNSLFCQLENNTVNST